MPRPHRRPPPQPCLSTQPSPSRVVLHRRSRLARRGPSHRARAPSRRAHKLNPSSMAYQRASTCRSLSITTTIQSRSSRRRRLCHAWRRLAFPELRPRHPRVLPFPTPLRHLPHLLWRPRHRSCPWSSRSRRKHRPSRRCRTSRPRQLNRAPFIRRRNPRITSHPSSLHPRPHPRHHHRHRRKWSLRICSTKTSNLRLLRFRNLPIGQPFLGIPLRLGLQRELPWRRVSS